VPADKFRGGVQDEVRPVHEGALEDRPEERVVHRDDRPGSAVAAHEPRDRLDIGQGQRRIRRRFEEDHIKGVVSPEDLFGVREVAGVHPDGRDAKTRRAQVCEEDVRPAIHRIRVENAPPLGHEGQDRRRDGAHA
jgi:hypothetical protein